MSKSNIPNLEKLRKGHGMTQAQLAEKIGVHKRTVLRWEAGDQDPNLTDLRNLAALFGISVGWLIGGWNDPDAERTT